MRSTGSSGSELIAVYNAASNANAESFPVLKAFQDYIEAERSQARKRVIQLSILFAVLMGVVVAGFLVAGIFMLRNMSNMQSRLLEMAFESTRQAPAQAPATPPPVSAPTQPVVVQTSPQLEDSLRQMNQTTAAMRNSLDKKMEDVSEITGKVHERVAAQDGELRTMRDAMKAMQEQSAKLSGELAELKKAPPTPTAAPAPTAATPPPPPAPPAKAQPAAAPVIAKTPPPAPPTKEPVAAAQPPAVQQVTAKTTPQAEVKPAASPPTETRAEPVAIARKPLPDPRFPPATKPPPTAGAAPAPATPPGTMATAVPLKAKGSGTVPWRVIIPE